MIAVLMSGALGSGQPGGDWTWRLSIADVPSRAVFSIFPGVDRFIACLTGPGLKLERAGARSLVPSEGKALSFAGEEAVTGEPLGPGVRDANLMLRRDRWRGRMTLVRGRGAELDATLVLVHAPENCPSLRVRTAEGDCDISPGGTLVASGPVALFGVPGSVGISCELTAVSTAPFRS